MGLGLARKVAQVGSKVFNQRGECAETRIRILTMMDAEDIIRCFPGAFGD
jgi:hypothetical protein